MTAPQTTSEPLRTAEREIRVAGVETQARAAAAEGAASPGPGAHPWLLAGLRAHETFLKAAVQHFREASAAEALSYAAEWMLDNFYVTQQSLRQIGEDMPRRYYEQLPKLIGGPLRGYPRIYDVAQRLVAMSAARLDVVQVHDFISAYQDVTELTTGELWALPVMLRLSTLDVLERALSRITGLVREDELPAVTVPAEVSEDEIVGYCFTSLRLLDTTDWKHFFESVSRVERTLSEDPAGIYSWMDVETRDQYRKIVEELSLQSGASEQEVARAAIRLAQAATGIEGLNREGLAQRPEFIPVVPGLEPGTLPGVDGTGHDLPDWQGIERPRAAHVGYYLLDEGRRALEEELGYRPTPLTRLARWAFAHPTLAYVGPILLLAMVMIAAAVAYTATAGGSGLKLLLAGILSVVPAITVAVAFVDWVVTLVVRPSILPKLDLSSGIPDSCGTLVVVPALLTSQAEINSLLAQIDQHYLRNPDPNLSFALLTDFADAPEQHMPEDEALLAQARSGIAALNARYGKEGPGPFYLFHRGRRWNEREGCWMGWERKRGKLRELNLWLRGDAGTSFITFPKTAAELRGATRIRYVITLDADTILGTDGARRLVGTLAHPLNRAQSDPKTGRVTKGYGLLQPRTENTASSANYSRFSRIFAGDIGLDLYTRAVSNVYQDLFGSGIYIGKGIYDVDAFERSLAGRVPENTLLSHDLFEGTYGRVGLVTDIVLYEDYPPTYVTYMRRLHRWTRGDWQLLPWLLPDAPGARGRKRASDFSARDTWKLLDNMRRSLLAPALMLLLIAGWLVLPGAAWLWTLAALLALAVPALIGALTPFVSGPATTPWRRSVHTLGDGGARWLLAVVFLPYEAAQMVDAIARTLARVLVTRRGLLEWTAAAEAARRSRDLGNRLRVYAEMRRSPITAALVVVLLLLVHPASLAVAAPLLVAWALAPEVAYRISLPIRHDPAPVTPEQRTMLRSLARRTWLFFEHYAGPEDHWLPPDHFQESPRGIVAHYTSPTNIGLLLLSTLAAYDLGYIGVASLVTRLQSTFEALARLERYRGHFLNWYDTRTLEPLLPRYVSTVDSGNLAACLRILGQGCRSIPQVPILRWARWEGLIDTFTLLDDFVSDLEAAEKITAARQVRERANELRAHISAVESDPDKWLAALDYVADEGWPHLQELVASLLEQPDVSLGSEAFSRLRIAVEAASAQIFTLQRYIRLLLPWLFLLRESRRPQIFTGSGTPPALAEAFGALTDLLHSNPPLEREPAMCQAALDALASLQERLGNLEKSQEVTQALDWCRDLHDGLVAAQSLSQEFLAGFREIDAQAEEYFETLDLGFLFESQRQVFHIGYNVTAGKLDGSYYDLLESEARIASLVALSKHQVPVSHWLHLARPLTQVDGMRALLSWSATMFEYLMPGLFMRSYPGTLLHESALAAVDLQAGYAARKGVPWGMSESGYYAFDANQNYQYRAFGVPGLGFKRNLAEDLVIAPYASLLALTLRPDLVASNIQHLARLGTLGLHGLYEAIDFTPARLPLGSEHAVVREYMAHHQGMILVALANYLQGGQMVQRFHSDPRFQSVELLLQERIPADAPLEFPQPGDVAPAHRTEPSVMTLPWNVPVTNAPLPHVHYLSNGRYSVLITSGGGGFSRWGDLDLTRWRADTTLDDWGQWIYIQDRDDGELWSAAFQPVGGTPAGIKVSYYPHMAEFQRTDHEIALTVQVTVDPEEDVEIRRVTVLNQSDRVRRLALTSYGEVVMADPLADLRHPAFNKLFIESEYVPDLGLFFRRRPRSEKEPRAFMAHMVVDARAPVSYESDRARFLGRGRTCGAPQALQDPESPLSGTTGATLDPIMALQRDIRLEPGETAELAFVTLAASERAQLIDTAGHFQSWLVIQHAFEQARSSAELELRQLGMSTIELQRIQDMLSALVYPFGGLRADPSVLAANTRGQSGLWGYSVSGDYPILLVRIADEDDLPFVHEVLQAHAYWRRRGLKIDLVILNEREASYSLGLRDELHRLMLRMQSDTWLNQRGGIFVVNASTMPDADRTLLETAARVILDAHQGGPAAQLETLSRQPGYLPPFVPEGAAEPLKPAPHLERPQELLFDNGLGGFNNGRTEGDPGGKAAGHEYVIYLEAGENTPAPWINVIANPEFGFLVSESGGGYSWASNSGENRLTPWSNDPVSDPAVEAVYLRDEETAEVWSPTPQPSGAAAPYVVRHGAGYTIFEHRSHGLQQRLRMFAVPDEPVKVLALRLDNLSGHTRRITATFYAEWVLGVTPQGSAQYVVPEFDEGSQALLARNAYNSEFSECYAFAAASKPLHGLTADRTEFLGRMGTRRYPAGLARIGLSGTVRAGLDPCAALQVHLDLPVGAGEEVWFLLGQGTDRGRAVELAGKFKDPGRMAEAWEAANHFWDELLGQVQVRTPEPAMDLLLNRWLLYEALSCRIWGRSAFYQSSGAFGFRDQLQDVMATVSARPSVAREQILVAARHQFERGDVLHWWHPPSGRGVRTRCSDDMLWLPFVTAHYVNATGDLAVLDEQVPFLRAAPLGPDEEERYGLYPSTSEMYSLYEHCMRAIERGSTSGPHGLPLIGTGDWNDGFNRVGVLGRGESIWLGWFLHATLTTFAGVCEQRGDADHAATYRGRADGLKTTLEDKAWDGAWYLRGFYDDGTPLGSSKSAECQIDAIAQSWAVLAAAFGGEAALGAGRTGRPSQAMGSVLRRLVRPEEGLVLLYTPPFDKTPRDPGYIKGYPPGIRENGGQYTHAALWTTWAFAELGETETAENLFRLLNPIYHADTPSKAARYKTEPYVVAADVYSVPPHTGRGGWTWYTGSAAWMYRLGLEGILGIHRSGTSLSITPHIPASWPGYEITYRNGSATYHIQVQNRPEAEQGATSVTVDGEQVTAGTIPLLDDGRRHEVEVAVKAGK